MKLVWDDSGKKIAETGVKKGVLYPMVAGLYTAGKAWNGLTSLNEAPTGAEASPFYADNQKYLAIMSDEEFAGTVGCYTYPDEFKPCIGEVDLSTGVSVGQQNHTKAGLCYRTELVNDTSGMEYGYKLHLVYDCLFGVSTRDHSTVNESPELEEMTFDFTATKVPVTGAKPTAHLVINSTKVDSTKLAILEDILFGTVAADARLPLPDEVASIFASAAPSAVALSTSDPEDEEDDVAINADIVLTFNNQILREAVAITSAAGAEVAGTKTWDPTGKILTFHPTNNLTNNTTYLIVVAGVVDIYGQALATVVNNFTTVE